MLQVIKRQKIWFMISGIILVSGILAIIFGGLKFGMDFTGGTLMEVAFEKNRPQTKEVEEALKPLDLGINTLQPAGEKDMVLRMKAMDNNKRKELIKKLNEKFGKIDEKRFESIGPTIGQELKRKAISAIAVVVLLIIVYIAYAFRKVTKQISSWKMGVCTVIALFHDLLLVIGVFALLGKFHGVEIDGLFVTALLTVLGYSVHDTIVIFDRVRYNLIKFPETPFEENVNNGINQTIVRSINTTATTLLVLSALYFFGGATMQWFIFALIIGFLTGTYSSIFIASPFLVMWERRSKRR